MCCRLLDFRCGCALFGDNILCRSLILRNPPGNTMPLNTETISLSLFILSTALQHFHIDCTLYDLLYDEDSRHWLANCKLI